MKGEGAISMRTLKEAAQAMKVTGSFSVKGLWQKSGLPDLWQKVGQPQPSPLSLRWLLEAGLIPKYTFSLDRFRITKTRAMHNDTDYVSFALKVGDQMFPNQTRGMGDLNDGTYDVGLKFEKIAIDDPSTAVIFNYAIVNNGHTDQATVDKMLNAWSEELRIEVAVASVLCAGAAAIIGVMAGCYEAFKKYLAPLIWADCDGFVAADQIQTTEDELRQSTSNSNGTFSQERFYPGTDSATVCGGNSQYYVTWSISRVW